MNNHQINQTQLSPGPLAGRGTSFIDFDQISKSFEIDGQKVVALENVTFNLSEGEFAAIIGPSGCGKSTALRIIAALEEPNSGTVTIAGQPPTQQSTEHALGVAFQDHALLPWLNVAENIELPFRISGRPVTAERIDELISLVGLTEFKSARPKQLSGGMRQRVSIARALALSPQLLLLDEPFGSLDAVTRRRMNIELQRIWSEFRPSTLLVTHAVEEALFLADRIFVLTGRPGRLLREVDVPFERPRTDDTMRSEFFHRMVDEMTAALDSTENAPQYAVESLD